MIKLRVAAGVALLAAGLLGAFGRPAEAGPNDYPWCMEDYWACVAQGQDISDCLCYRQMCMGGTCQ